MSKPMWEVVRDQTNLIEKMMAEHLGTSDRTAVDDADAEPGSEIIEPWDINPEDNK